MIGHSLQHVQGIVVVIGKYRGAREQQDVFGVLEFLETAGRPVHSHRTINPLVIAQQGTAHF